MLGRVALRWTGEHPFYCPPDVAIGAIEVARWQRRFKLAPSERPAKAPPSRY